MTLIAKHVARCFTALDVRRTENDQAFSAHHYSGFAAQFNASRSLIAAGIAKRHCVSSGNALAKLNIKPFQ